MGIRANSSPVIARKASSDKHSESGKARSQVIGPGLGLARIMSEHRTTSSKDLTLSVAPETMV